MLKLVRSPILFALSLSLATVSFAADSHHSATTHVKSQAHSLHKASNKHSNASHPSHAQPQASKEASPKTVMSLIKDQCTQGIVEGMKEGLKGQEHTLDDQYIHSFAADVCNCALPKIKNVLFEQERKVVDAAMEKALHECAQHSLNKEKFQS